jgi:hypothetical protein
MVHKLLPCATSTAFGTPSISSAALAAPTPSRQNWKTPSAPTVPRRSVQRGTLSIRRISQPDHFLGPNVCLHLRPPGPARRSRSSDRTPPSVAAPRKWARSDVSVARDSKRQRAATPNVSDRVAGTHCRNSLTWICDPVVRRCTSRKPHRWPRRPGRTRRRTATGRDRMRSPDMPGCHR